jgi:O-antigen ligase
MTVAITRFFRDSVWRENAVAAYAAVGILVFLTSFFWAPTRDFMHVVYGLAFFAPVLLVLLLRKPDFNQYGGWFTGLALIYAAYASISTLWSDAPRLEFFAQHFLFLAVWLAGTSWLAQRGSLDFPKICDALIVASAIAAIVCLGVFYSLFPLSDRLDLEVYGVARNPNVLGGIFGAMALVGYCRLLESKSRREFAARLLLSIPALLVLGASQSRGAIISFVLVALVAMVLHRRRPKWRVLAGCGLGFLVLCGLAIAIQPDALVETIKARLSEPSYRLDIWKELLRVTLEDHVFLGTGMVKTSLLTIPGVSDRVDFIPHAHNSFIDAFYRTGLVGLMLMTTYTVFLIIGSLRCPSSLPFLLWFLVGCTSSLFDNAAFFRYLEASWFTTWIPAGLIAASLVAKRKSC